MEASISKVWAVIRNIDYEGSDEPDSIWTTKEAAIKRRDDLRGSIRFPDVHCEVYEYTLNEVSVER